MTKTCYCTRSRSRSTFSIPPSSQFLSKTKWASSVSCQSWWNPSIRNVSAGTFHTVHWNYCLRVRHKRRTPTLSTPPSTFPTVFWSLAYLSFTLLHCFITHYLFRIEHYAFTSVDIKQSANEIELSEPLRDTDRRYCNMLSKADLVKTFNRNFPPDSTRPLLQNNLRILRFSTRQDLDHDKQYSLMAAVHAFQAPSILTDIDPRWGRSPRSEQCLPGLFPYNPSPFRIFHVHFNAARFGPHVYLISQNHLSSHCRDLYTDRNRRQNNGHALRECNKAMAMVDKELSNLACWVCGYAGQ